MGIDLPLPPSPGLPDPVGSWLLQLTPSIILVVLFFPPCESCPFFFVQVSWAWQWLCRLSLVQLFSGNLFYALLSLRGGGEWWWWKTLFEHLQMMLGMAALFFFLPSLL